MKKQIFLPFDSKYKWYSFSELKDGVNEIFRYVKNFKNNTFDTVKMFIYVHNGEFIRNTLTPRFDSCKFRFNGILKANGDISKIPFECKHKLEIL
jgi:hypothetical protein